VLAEGDNDLLLMCWIGLTRVTLSRATVPDHITPDDAAMRRWRLFLLAIALYWPVLLLSGSTPTPAGRVLLLNISGAIGPATSDYVHRGLAKAQDMGATLVILRMDTPGGLDTAMRRMIQDILASPVPVATYVAPSGARAASAGTYILLASSVAAMAPATTVGAATPVRITGAPFPGSPEPADKSPQKNGGKKPPATAKPGMDEKVLNDAVSYIRGLAQLHGRNVNWAEKAVREADSIAAAEAVQLRVADVMAVDVAELLQKLDGRSVKVKDAVITLNTRGLDIQTYEPDWRNRLLSVIADPNIAYILMLLGIYGLFFELWNPGFILPGVIGGISLLLALYAFQLLPINYTGLGLILLGIGFMVAEVFVPSFGALGIGGVVAFIVGSIVLMDTDIEGYTIAWPLIVSVAAISAAFFLGVVYFAMRARRRRVVSGQEEMLGATGVALEDFTDTGRVRIHSEEWQARAATAIRQGQKVIVTAMDGLVLQVKPESTEGH
jgi:membrane-bound serine protease (ClpP class)